MGFHFSVSVFHFRSNHAFQNIILKRSALISLFSTVAANNPFYRNIFVNCSKKSALQPGRQAHAQMIVSGFNPTVVEANRLLQMYIKCSLLEYASKVSDKMLERKCVSWTPMISGYSVNGKMGLVQSSFDMKPERNVISWNYLISGYLQNGNCLKSVEVFVMMGRDGGVAYNGYTFSIVLTAIAKMEDYVLGLQVHGVVVKFGFEYCNVVTTAAMLNMYAKCNMLDESLRFFHAMPVRDTVSFSTIIARSVQNGKLEDGLELFKRMLREGVGLHHSVYASVFKSCAGLSDSRLGLQLHGHALKSGFEAETIVGTAVLDMYVKCDDLVSATKVFNLLPNPDLQSYTALIVGYARDDRGHEGTQLFLLLLKTGLGFNEISLSAAFSACAVSKGLMVGIQIHGLAIKTPFHDIISVATAILQMYGKCGSLPEAFHLFNEMKSRDVISWTSMICAYADHGYGNEALQVFEKMLLEKVMPNDVTFTGVLSACAHNGLVDEAFHYLYTMKSNYGVEPGLIHYSCMVDALGRCGRIADALELVREMPLEGSSSSSSSSSSSKIWTSLLSNCKKQGNVEVAEIAASSLLQLDPQNSKVYLLLSQIYAEAGMWDEASKLRRMMRSSGVKKGAAGCSWIEVSSL